MIPDLPEGITRPAERRELRADQIKHGVLALLDNPEARETLRHVAHEYSRTIDDALSLGHLLVSYSSISYLLDFDVLHNYLEHRTASSADTLTTDFLIDRSRQPYALPIGAYLELVEWLRKSTNVEFALPWSRASADRAAALRELGSQLIGRRAKSLNESDLLAEIGKRIDNKTVVLSRALTFLSSDRFRGVVVEHEQADLDFIEPLLSEARTLRAGRQRRKLSSKRDRRDAMNLAIAVNEARQNRKDANAGKRSPGYLLVTNTRAVAEFGRQLMSRRSTDNDVRQFLAAEQFVPADLPVATAANVARVEMLGLFQDPGISLLRATEIRRNFQNIADTLDLEVTSRKLSITGAASPASYEDALRLRRGVVVDALQSLLKPLLNPDDPLRRLELHRATELSIEGMRHAQRGHEPSEWEALRLKSIGFLSLLSQVQASLVRAAGTEYQVAWTDAPKGKRFSITLGNADQPRETLITGSVSIGGPLERSEYVTRWPVVCGIDDFWIAVRTLSGVDIADGALPAMPAVARLEAEIPLETDCLIARTRDAAFIVPLTDVLRDHGTGVKCLADIARAIRRLEPSEGELVSIEIHKDCVALSFAIIPNDGDSERSLSSRTLGRLNKLAGIYARTGLFLADETALGKVLTFIETESQKLREPKVEDSPELVGSKAFASTAEIPSTDAETSETVLRITHTAQSGRSKVEMELQAHLYPGSGDLATLIGAFLAAISEKRIGHIPGVTESNTPHGIGDSNSPSSDLAREAEAGSVLRRRLTRSETKETDIGILTVVSAEMLAVKNYLAQRPQYQERRGTANSRFFYEGTLGAPGGAYHRVTVTRTLEQGNRSIMAAYQALVEEYRPTVVVLLGIAGAIHSDIALCDVALAEAIYYYDRRAVKREGTNRRILSYNIAPWLRVWINRLYEMYPLPPMFDAEPGSPSDKFKMLFGPIGAGEAVIKYRDADERKWLETVNDKTLALETEAAGVAQQFSEGELSLGHRPKGYLIVRGISDHANAQKDDKWQYLASCNAIRGLEELLKTIPAPLSDLEP